MARSLCLFIALLLQTVGLGASASPGICGGLLSQHPQLACGVCMEIQSGQDCSHFDACECLSPRHIGVSCAEAGFCSPSTGEPQAQKESLGLRVSKGYGTRDYAMVRLTIISHTSEAPAAGFFDYSAAFKFRWTGNYVHTAVKQVTPGRSTAFAIGNHSVSVRVPALGAGVAGVLLGDPCVRWASITSLVSCEYAEKFKTSERTPGLLNAFVASEDIDYWGILGDNFYDRTGETTIEFFSKLSQGVKETPLVTVPGNHDYWVLGSPQYGSTADQCGNGHMQFYGQDTEAASQVMPGDSTAPFNFSADPSAGRILLGCNPASADNSRFFHQMGNLGIIGQSGVFTTEEYMPFMQAACKWLASTAGIEVGMIVGHWDVLSNGAKKNMDVPHFFDQMAKLPGCDTLNAAGNLKFFMGHTHCNIPHPHGHNDTGFMVAGWGMSGCGNYGMPVFDTTEGRNRVHYFDASSDAKYKAVTTCVSSKGWRKCLSLAETWLDQPRSSAAAIQAWV